MNAKSINLSAPTNGHTQETASANRAAAAAPMFASGDEPINILIVDDEPKNLTVLETVLDAPRYRLVRAESAEQALLALLVQEFAVLILDIHMPGVTGFELAHMIKERKKTSQVPIIFLTAYYNEDQHVLEGYDTGAVDYLHKPINAAILRSKVAVLAELHYKQRELENANRALLGEVTERRRVQEQLHELNNTLERRVTERTEALRESAVLLRAAADNASVGLVILDRERRYKFANSAYCKILGLSEDIIGMTQAEILAPVYKEQILPRLDRAFAGGRVAFELKRAALDGAIGKFNYFSVVYEPEREGDGSVTGMVVVVFDITDRKWAEEHIRLLMNEVNHRSKNILSVVMAVAQQTVASSPEEFVQRFSNRVHALAVNHDLLVKSQWKSIKASDLIRGQLAHFGDLVGQRIILDGPPLRLSAAAAQCIGMVVHELSTNAVKHGALSGQDGRVEITWRGENGGAGERFTISWIERDGPPVVAPTHRGFGSTVITKMAEMSLDGEIQLDYASSGLIWRLACPVKNALDNGGFLDGGSERDDY